MMPIHFALQSDGRQFIFLTLMALLMLCLLVVERRLHRQRTSRFTPLVYPARPPAGPLVGEGAPEDLPETALIALIRGDWPQAHRALWDAKPEQPDPWFSYHIGLALQQQGRYQEAESCYRTTLQHVPEHAEAAYNLAGLLAEVGRWSEAILLYKRVVSWRADWADAHYNLGHVYMQLRMYQEAERFWHRTSQLQPRGKDVQTGLRFLRRLRQTSQKGNRTA